MAKESLRSRIRSAESRPWWRLVAFVTGVLASLTRSATWHFRLAYARERLHQRTAARKAYERALADARRPVDWFHRLAELHRQEQDWTAVARVYGAARDADPARRDILLGLGEALEQLARWDEAVELYRDACREAPDDVELLILLAGAYDRAHEPAAAIATYQAALERRPDDVGVLERLGTAHFREGELDVAVAVVRRALDLDPLTASASLRLRMAEVYDLAGHWQEACRWLEENLEHHPSNAQTYRLLARAASRAYDHGGYFEGSLASPEDTRYHSLPSSGSGDPSPEERSLTEYLHLACWAMESAVLLAPKRVVWLGTLGALRAEAGYEWGALSAYQQAFDAGSRSNRIPIVKALQGWQFEMERLRHVVGRGQVEDPLFASEAVTVDPPEEQDQPAGLYTLEFDFEGLRIRGLVTSCDVTAVEIRLDGQLLRALTLSEEGFFPRFAFRIDRQTLDLFPPKGRLTVTTADGCELLAGGRGRALELRLPHGDGAIRAVLERGEVLDKKGNVRPSPDDVRRRQDAYLRLYELARDFFDHELGRQVFLMYGTLLGVHRDGDFIPGDDDFDAGYVSNEASPESVKEETKGLIVRLVQAGFTVSFNRRGRLFRLQHPSIEESGLHLDLRPLWFEDGRLWVHNYVSYPSTPADFVPADRATLRGTTVYVPRRTEAFLEAHYGSNWRVPDPSFTYHPGDVAPKVMAHLERALLTPREYRALRAYLESDEGARPGMGRLVSLAEQPLYPLDEYMA